MWIVKWLEDVHSDDTPARWARTVGAVADYISQTHWICCTRRPAIHREAPHASVVAKGPAAPISVSLTRASDAGRGGIFGPSFRSDFGGTAGGVGDCSRGAGAATHGQAFGGQQQEPPQASSGSVSPAIVSNASIPVDAPPHATNA